MTAREGGHLFIFPKDKKHLFKKDPDFKFVKFTFSEQKGDKSWTFKVARLEPSVEDILDEPDQKNQQRRCLRPRAEVVAVKDKPQKQLGAPARKQSLDKVQAPKK